MHRYLECAASLAPSLNCVDLALQRALIHVPANAVIDLHYRRHCALPKARDRPNRELVVRCRLQDFLAVCFGRFLKPQAEFQPSALEQVARSSRMACRSTTDTNSVVALRLQVEECVERGNAINPR